jgi:outer membrane protein TolC
MLIGKQASAFSIPVVAKTTAPPPIPVGLPSQLLERRPDVAAAERTMASANAQIGVAYAAYYPSLTISGSGGFESSTIGKLLDATSRFWSVGPRSLRPFTTEACAAPPSINTSPHTTQILPPIASRC